MMNMATGVQQSLYIWLKWKSTNRFTYHLDAYDHRCRMCLALLAAFEYWAFRCCCPNRCDSLSGQHLNDWTFDAATMAVDRSYLHCAAFDPVAMTDSTFAVMMTVLQLYLAAAAAVAVVFAVIASKCHHQLLTSHSNSLDHCISIYPDYADLWWETTTKKCKLNLVYFNIGNADDSDVLSICMARILFIVQCPNFDCQLNSITKFSFSNAICLINKQKQFERIKRIDVIVSFW